MSETGEWHDVYYTSHDGLRLHVRHYPAPGSSRRPVVCLPGLTRNARDFHRLAATLADPRRHRRAVYCLDYRGRGLSQYDPDWRNYAPLIECIDVLDFMTLADIHHAAVIGTSRGGIIAMIMAVLRPAAVGAAVLNDIGPVIERDGLARIIGYVGRVPLPADWDEAAQLIREMSAADFPAISDEEWREVAHQWFNDENGAPSPGYDPKLAKAITNLDIERDIPAMWPQFIALSRVPVLTLRGENSDILSEETVEGMAQHNPRMRRATIPGQGHAPLLRDDDTIHLIEQFLIETDEEAHTNASHLSAVA